MAEETRPKEDCIAEIKTYNGKLLTDDRKDDLRILSEELGEEYEVKWWLFGKHIRVAIIKGGKTL